MFDAASGREIAVLKGHGNEVNDATFSSDGTRIATVSNDGSARVWNAGNGGEIAVLKGHLPSAETVAFGPDGQRIFSASGVEAIMWTKLAASRLPDNIAGLWFGNFGPRTSRLRSPGTDA